jgi:hypothetical protein
LKLGVKSCVNRTGTGSFALIDENRINHSYFGFLTLEGHSGEPVEPRKEEPKVGESIRL